MTRLRLREPKDERAKERFEANMHQTKQSFGGPPPLQEVASLIPGHKRLIDPNTKVGFNVCPTCSFRKCLKANDLKASCDGRRPCSVHCT